MCDYSLMMVHSRLAAEGEDLVAHKFQTGSVGLVSCTDFSAWQARRCMGLWQRLKSWFSSDQEPAPVVCIPPGARLTVFDIPKALQKQFRLGECEEVTFTQISAQERQHRDAICFANGTTLLLGFLHEGQRIRVLRLSASADLEPVPELAGIA